MRLSLLLAREPFGAILEATLSRFWSERYGHPVAVRWGETAGGQDWRGNPYLNFFCVDATDPRCFDVLRKEYSYARRRWLRPFQRAYVSFALLRHVRRYCSRLGFSVTPAVPDAAAQIVVPGNHRIRLLCPSRGEVHVLHKVGFPPAPFLRELSARQGWAATVAPAILHVDPHARWFTESYFSGTPANRLPPKQQVQVRREAVTMLAERVHQSSLSQHALSGYAHSITTRITDLAPSLTECARVIGASVLGATGSSHLATVRSHGDFQDANILSSPDHGVRIIDWEFSQERSHLYDLVTLLSGIRLAHNWIDCWRSCARAWIASPGRVGDFSPSAPTFCRQLAFVWLLEELLLRVEQPRMRPQHRGSDDRTPQAAAVLAAAEAVI